LEISNIRTTLEMDCYPSIWGLCVISCSPTQWEWSFK